MHDFDPQILNQIHRQLASIERDNDVRILYACEMGSRAWGFAADDSDFDVRFIYVQSQDWYLSVDVEQKRDVIELPVNDDWDFSGWDIRKALQLLRKSNPGLHEWLASPIVYVEHGAFAQQLRQLGAQFYNPIAGHSHYVRMAVRHYRAYLKNETFQRKKYLHVLRPLLTALWIESNEGTPPMEFDTLVSELVSAPGLLEEIRELLRQKRAGCAMGEGPRLPAIHAFVDAELERLQDFTVKRNYPQADVELLNRLFRATLAANTADLPTAE